MPSVFYKKLSVASLHLLTSVFERSEEFYKLKHVAFSAFMKVRMNIFFRKEKKNHHKFFQKKTQEEHFQVECVGNPFVQFVNYEIV